MKLTIKSINALEILDSRGRPAMEAEVELSNGLRAAAQVPSGASTGRHEALELRDGGTRYAGKGMRQAVAHVETEIAQAVIGMDAENLAAIDARMIALDGTPNKSRLGANALLGVSCAVARAISQLRAEPLWKTIAALSNLAAPVMPVPMVNILSGGLHAGRNLELQDFLAIGHGFDTYSEALEAIVAVHAAAHDLLESRGYILTGVADEGGWGPRLESNELAIDFLVQAIQRAGYRGRISIALDVASSHFFDNGFYRIASKLQPLSAADMINLLAAWCTRYPIASIEDGLEQDQWEGWRQLTARLGDRIQLIGDDFFTTNPDRVRRGIESVAANAVLVKMNQIGTLTETFEVLRLAQQAGFRTVVSARSGETEDSFLADLAVGTGAGQIKVGSITRSERLAKYNRLLRIERDARLPFVGAALFPSSN